VCHRRGPMFIGKKMYYLLGSLAALAALAGGVAQVYAADTEPTWEITQTEQTDASSTIQTPPVFEVKRDVGLGERVSRRFSDWWSEEPQPSIASELAVTLAAPNGEEHTVAVAEVSRDEASIQLDAGQVTQPGAYELTVRQGEIEEKKKFLWGVLALNVPFSSVRPGETVPLDITVLNEHGVPFCAAPVWLKITAPDGKETELSTEHGQVVPTSACSQYELTFMPDLVAQFQTTVEGIYQIRAETEVGGQRYHIDRAMQVQAAAPFQVQRQTATRLYPAHVYPVGLTVHSASEWRGTIREPVPMSIDLKIQPEVWQDGIAWEALADEIDTSVWLQAALPSRVVEDGGKRFLEWDVALAGGVPIQLGYAYDPPDQSPALLGLGPLTIGLWSEPQVWQLAVDVITIDTSIGSASGVQNNHQPNLVFTSDSVGYVFYTDAGNICRYSKTTDGGATWGSAVTVDSQNDCVSIGVWYDQWTPGDTSGTIIHIVSLDSGSSEVWYNQLDTSSDTLSTTLNVTGANQGGSFVAGANFAVITKSSSGSIYTAVNDNSDSFMLRCNSSCTANISNWTEAGTSPFDLDTDYVAIMPLTSGDVVAVRWDVSGDEIASREYEDGGNAWDGAWLSILTGADENATQDSAYSFAQDPSDSDIFMTVVEDASTLGTDDLKAFSYNGTTWSTLTDLLTDTGEGIAGTSLQFDSNTNTLYASYNNYRSLNAGSPYMKYSTDFGTTWSSEIGPLNDYAMPVQGIKGGPVNKYRLMLDWYVNNTIDLEAAYLANTTASQDWIAVGKSGSATATTTGGSNVSAGGAWTFVRSASTANITQIVVTDVGSVDAETELTNLDLYYETTGSCNYDGNESLFGTASTFSSSEEATVTGTMSIGTSQVCVYAVVDISAGAAGDTMMLELSDPNADVTVSAGNIPLQARVRLTGITDINGSQQTTQALIDGSAVGDQNRFFGQASAVFTSDLVGYAFYIDTGGNCVYSKTTDGGATWGSAVTVDTVNTTDAIGYAVWYDQWTPGDTSGTVIYVATIDTGADDLYYTSLDTATDTLGTTTNTTGANQGGAYASGANFVSITKGTNGVLYVTTTDDQDSFMLRCTGTCATASNWTEAGTSPYTTTDGNYQLIVPQSGDNIMAIQQEVATDLLKSQLYTYSSNTWSGSWTTIESSLLENSTYDSPISAVVDKTSYDIFLTWLKGQEVPGFNDEIHTAVYSSATWTAKTDVIEDTANANILNASLAYDQLSETVWSVWTQADDKIDRNFQNFYVSSSTDDMTTWSTPTRINTTASDRRMVRTNYLSSTRLYAVWHDYLVADFYGNTIYNIPVALTVSGNAYQSDGTTVLTECDGSTANIKLYAEGRTYTTSCNDSTGAWSFANVVEVQEDDTLVVFYDGMTPNGSTVIRADTTGSNITGLKISTDRVWLVNESDGTLTNSLIGAYDSSDDGDVNYTLSGSDLTLASSTGLILRSKTSNTGVLSYDPGGALVVPGLMTLEQNTTAEIDVGTNSIGGTLALATGTTLTIKGNTTLAGSSPVISTTGTATLTSSGTPTVTVTGTGDLGGGSNALTFYTLSLSPTSGTISPNSPITVQNNLTVGNGTNGMTFNNETNDETLNVDGNFTISANGIFSGSSSASQTFAGNWLNSGTFTANTSTITLDGLSGTKTLTGGSSSFYNLTINDSAGSVTQQLGGALDVDNDLTITGGTLDVSGSNYAIAVGGDWVNDDIFIAGTGTVTLDGSGTLTLDSGCSDVTSCTNQDFYNLTINQPSNANTMTLTSTHLRVGNTLTITRGILSQGTFNVRALGTTAVSIGANGTWENISTGDISLGGNLSNAGTLTFKGNNTCGGADDIVITSTSGTPSWSGAGSFELRDVSLANQNASVAISVFSSTDAGGNTGSWTFYPGCVAGSLSADIVDSDGDSVTSPTVTMSPAAFALVSQTVDGTFGESTQRLRIENTTASAPWSLSVAADAGPTATWSTGSQEYDFNDPSPSAGDGIDADGFGGQLEVDPSVATSAPEGGCTNTGISLGSQSAFNQEDATNSITIVSADGTAETSCYWDITGVDLLQSIPAEQVNGAYTIDMTITAVAI
jgi:hypothetical protein